jgi:hypothetical protein
MVLFKQVNGVKFQLSDEEEKKTRDRWAENKIKKEEKRLIAAENKIQKKKKQDSLMDKFNLTQEEFDLIKNG